MAKKSSYKSSQFLNFTEDSYLEQSSRPFCAAIFLLPFIIFYEVGTIFINTDVLHQSQIRVVAFVWLQNLLEQLGFGSRLAWMAPPIAVLAILVAQQLASKKRWRFNFSLVGPMGVECIMLAVPLIVLSLFLNTSATGQGSAEQLHRDLNYAQQRVSVCAAAEIVADEQGDVIIIGGRRLFADIVTGIGAGIYEELVFRLILICILMLVFQDILRMSSVNSAVLSVLISAALFSAHHHIFFVDGVLNQTMPFNWTEFIFRAAAGIYFAGLFAVRGFGIAAGTHAFYDTMAVLINAMFFDA